MSKVLKNLQLTFGETPTSPKVLPIASVNTLIKAIEDPEVNTRFSGHITSESGSLNAAQAYTLSMAGLTFHGNITPVDFTLKANKTEIVDNNEVLFTTTGVPVSAINFIINNITINSGDISKTDIENICSIENNKLIVAPAGVTYDWQATIEVKAITKYTPSTEKTINIIVKHKAYNNIVPNQTNINFDIPTTINVPLSFTPVNANVPIESIRATLENVSAIYEVGVLGNSISITCNSTDDLVSNKVNIEVTDIAGKKLNTSITISNKVITTPKIVSEDSFVAKNGKGSLQCTFGFTPEKYNVDVEFISVTSNNNLINITNASINGFTLNTTDVTTDTSTIITAKIKVDGVEQTITKTINITYQQIFNEFKVYANSAWVVPTSNVEVKVGDVPTTYIGEGLWLVDESLVDDSMYVTVGGVVFGKYGLNEYSDESAIYTATPIFLNKTVSMLNVHVQELDYNKLIELGIKKNEKYVPIYKISRVVQNCKGSGYVNYNDHTSFNFLHTPITSTNETVSTRSFLFTDDITTIVFGLVRDNDSTISFYYGLGIPKIDINNVSKLLSDLTLPSTSLIAKNGTLNELITPDTPNTSDITLTNITSSNSAISASIVDNKIKLTGTIADGNPQSSKLTIYYSVNGYSRSVEINVNAEYVEGPVEPANFDSLPGDVLCSDMSVVRPVIASDGYTVESVDLGGKTPIAVCIVPALHMYNGEGRWMSLDFMDCANPDSGSQSETRPTMYWGGYGTDLSTLPNLDTCILQNGSTNSYSRLGSKTAFNTSNFTRQVDGLYYSGTDTNLAPAPFNTDGSCNNTYRQLATGDFDGKGNTDKLIAATTVSWSSGSISNSSSAGNYPAACCCRRYCTTGTNAGDWYLPAMGELGYLMYNAQLIDNVLTKIGKVTNSNSIYLWASTESSSTGARNLTLGYGIVYGNNKDSNRYIRAFLAF